jgi:long-chain acyl-CoA synthetase
VSRSRRSTPAQPVGALRSQLRDSGAKALVTHPANAAALVEAAGPAVELVVHVPETAASPAPNDAGAMPSGWLPLRELLDGKRLEGYRPDPGLIAHLQPTGGTTGRSKAVRVLHHNPAANVPQTGCCHSATHPGPRRGRT